MSEKSKPSLAIAYGVQKQARKKGMAMGGMVKPDHEEHYDSIADAIMRKKKMANGGEVADIQSNGDEDPNEYDRLNAEAVGEVYDDSQLSSQPEDSNEMGDDEDADDHDMVGSIRKKMKSKV